MKKLLALAAFALLLVPFAFALDPSPSPIGADLAQENYRLSQENTQLRAQVESNQFYRNLYDSDKKDLDAALSGFNATMYDYNKQTLDSNNLLYGLKNEVEFKMDAVKIWFAIGSLFGGMLAGLITFWVMRSYRGSERAVEAVKKGESLMTTESGEQVK